MKYTKEQIEESIKHWENVLEMMNESPEDPDDEGTLDSASPDNSSSKPEKKKSEKKSSKKSSSTSKSKKPVKKTTKKTSSKKSSEKKVSKKSSDSKKKVEKKKDEGKGGEDAQKKSDSSKEEKKDSSKKEVKKSDDIKLHPSKAKKGEITDKVIDYKTVRCRCIFADKEFQDYLASLAKTPDITDEDKKQIEAVQTESLNEGFLGKLVKGAGKLTMKALKGTAKLTGKALWKVAKVVGKFTGKYGKKALIAAGCLTMAIAKQSAKAIGYASKQTASYIAAKGKHIITTVGNQRNLAEMLFTANGVKYKFFYNMTENKWMLNYASANVLSKKSVPSKEEVDSFTKTDLGTKFINKCKEYIEPVITNDSILPALASDMFNTDKKTAVIFKEIYDNRQNIVNNMFAGEMKYL